MKVGLINLIICFVVAMILAPFMIKFLRKLKFGQSILVYVEAHKTKSGTPTMGGIIFILSAIVGYFLFWSKNNVFATISILSLVFFGVIGFLDDFIKIKYKQNEGLKPYQKLIGQFGIAVIIAVFVYKSELIGSEVILPFTGMSIDFGFWIVPFVIFVYLAIVNSVNLIDGLDGLCSSVSAIVLSAFSIVIFLKKTLVDGVYANEINNLVIVTLGLVGAILGFIFFNSHPARCFMGDAGSLALGGYIASVFVVTRQYLLFLILGCAYVLTVISVVLQVGYYKLTKKRIFRMAPLHHHFELKYGETKVVSWYKIFTIILCVLTIILYV
ncbi:MAG: phospho-N-acetylmuramoyl-pentapeptide-transferase [Clostridiales bacterium]|nr:phospho-N-acetylmuramoyl-pentapeptide-transferase [Clostridiales bacterium]